VILGSKVEEEVAAGQEKLWRETRVFCRCRLNEFCTFTEPKSLGQRDPCAFGECPLVARARKEAV